MIVEGVLDPTGRPLSFDRDAALERAMLLFWKHGYDATSLAELTAAMGVTPPSGYTAFGDKKRLFLEAVDHYVTLSSWSAQLIFRPVPSPHARARGTRRRE